MIINSKLNVIRVQLIPTFIAIIKISENHMTRNCSIFGWKSRNEPLYHCQRVVYKDVEGESEGGCKTTLTQYELII